MASGGAHAALPGVVPGAAYVPFEFADGGRSDVVTGTLAQQLGWILHVVTSDGSPRGYFASLRSPDRKTSTGWVAKDGRIEQYLPFTHKPWAQGDGNATYAAWETEGTVDQALTAAQVDALARIHIAGGYPDRIANAPGERGIGTHAMGGNAWGGHPCPGQLRAAQRPAILARVAQIRAGNGPLPAPPPTPNVIPTLRTPEAAMILVPTLNDGWFLTWPAGDHLAYTAIPDGDVAALRDANFPALTKPLSAAVAGRLFQLQARYQDPNPIDPAALAAQLAAALAPHLVATVDTAALAAAVAAAVAPADQAALAAVLHTALTQVHVTLT